MYVSYKYEKYLRLLLEVYFYNIIIGATFILLKYDSFSISRLVEILWPIGDVSKGFTSCFLVFYLILPFLKILVSHLGEKLHLKLMLLLLFVFTVMPIIPTYDIQFNYVTWFAVIYLIASYIRIYDKEIFSNNKIWAWIMTASVFLSILSVILGAWVGSKIGAYPHYYFVIDSNKILAVTTSVSAFLFFKNLNIKQSKIINSVSSSTFGVLLIHANCDSMRTWLWDDVLNNVRYFDSKYFVFHAIGSVLIVFFACVFIDKIRIAVIEKPVMRILDSKWDRICCYFGNIERNLLKKLNISN